MSVDYLSEDTLVPSGQNYLCVSFLKDPEGKKSLRGVKVRGVFDKAEEAQEFAKKLQAVDPLHDIFLGEVGKWLAFDPDPSSKEAGSPEHANEELNKIMKSHMESNEKSKLFHEHRKNQQARENIEASIKVTNENKIELQEKLNDENDETVQESLKDKLKNIEEQLEKLESTKKDYKKQEELCSKKLEKMNPVESNDDINEV